MKYQYSIVLVLNKTKQNEAHSTNKIGWQAKKGLISNFVSIIMSPFLSFFIVQPGWISRARGGQVSGVGLCHQGFRLSFAEFLWDLMAFVGHIPPSAKFAFRSVAFRQLSQINIIIFHSLINYARGGISRRLIGVTPQCNSSLELELEDL